MKTHHILLSSLLILFGSFGLLSAKGKVWIEPETASKENPDFLIQGEYFKKDNLGIQVVALGGGNFQASIHQGGLPGAGAKGKPTVLKGRTSDGKTQLIGQEGQSLVISDGKAKLGGVTCKKIERKSPTLGQAPPKGATILYDGKTNAFNPGRHEASTLPKVKYPKENSRTSTCISSSAPPLNLQQNPEAKTEEIVGSTFSIITRRRYLILLVSRPSLTLWGTLSYKSS